MASVVPRGQPRGVLPGGASPRRSRAAACAWCAGPRAMSGQRTGRACAAPACPQWASEARALPSTSAATGSSARRPPGSASVAARWPPASAGPLIVSRRCARRTTSHGSRRAGTAGRLRRLVRPAAGTGLRQADGRVARPGRTGAAGGALRPVVPSPGRAADHAPGRADGGEPAVGRGGGQRLRPDDRPHPRRAAAVRDLHPRPAEVGDGNPGHRSGQGRLGSAGVRPGRAKACISARSASHG